MRDFDVKFRSPVPYGPDNRSEFKFMLGEPKNGKPWEVYSKDLLPPSLVTGEASYDNIRPDEIGPLFIASDWIRGFGAKDKDEDYRYLSGVDTDARFKGRIMLSPAQLAALSLPASTTTTIPMTNGTLESWNDDNDVPTGWSTTVDTYSAVDRSTTKHGGSYAARLKGDEGDSSYLIYTFPFDTTLRAKTVTVTFWGYKDAGLDLFSGYIEDGVDTTTTTVTDTSYAQKTITHTFNAAATQFVLTFKAYESSSTAAYAYVDDVTCTRSDTPYGTCVKGLTFGSSMVAAFGSTLVKSTDGASVTVVCDFGATITDLKIFGDDLIIALGADNVALYTSDLSTFTKLSTYMGGALSTTTTADYTGADTAINVTSTTGFDSTYVIWEDEVCTRSANASSTQFTLVRGALGTTAVAHASGTTIRELDTAGEIKYLGVTGQQLWASVGNNSVAVTDDIVSTPFSTVYTVGQSGFNITGLVDNPEGTVFVACQDQPYYLSGADVLPVAGEIASHSSTTTDYPLHVWKGILFMARGVNKLYALDIIDNVLEDISPSRWNPTDSDYDGRILCMAFDSDWAYCAVENGTKVEILAGRYEIIDSVEWVWHTLYEETTNDYTAMWVSNVSGSNVLYAATATASDGIDVFALPQSYSDNLVEGIAFQAVGTHTEPYIITNFSENDKLWSGVYVSAFNFNGVTSVAVYYQLDSDSDWTLLGMCKSASYDWANAVWPAEQTSYFPIGLVSRKIRFKFELRNALDGSTTTLSPVITRYRIDGKVENSLDGTSFDKAMIQCAIKCVGEAPSGGANMVRTTTGELAVLWWLKRLGQPVTMYGYDGIERTVKFRSLKHEAIGEPTQGKPLFLATALLEET